MSNIEVNKYVRTKKGFIAKVSEIESGYIFSDDTIDMVYEECRGYVEEKEISNHSKNIIDLIEVGDYVNGYLVTYVDKFSNQLDILDGRFEYPSTIDSKDIKSIVTKEQFKSIEYEVE